MLKSLDKKKLSIAFTDRALCARSGTCVGVCPEGAIEIGSDGYPVMPDEGKCNECGLCAKTCPGGSVNYAELARTTFALDSDPDEFDGHVEKTLVGYANDEKIRGAGAGGGVITALLWDLLEHKDIDGCVVTRMKPDQPWVGEAFMATTYEDLLASQGSKYTIIPLNAMIETILNTDGRFAVAALPCHVHGLRKAQQEIPALAEKLVAIVGLFCGGGLEPHLVPELLQTKALSTEDISDFQFRGGKWPGKMRAILKDGSIKNMHYSNYKDGAYNYCTALYMPTRCTTCLDGSGEFADVSVSDAWTRDSDGNYKYEAHSKVLVRTQRGLEIVASAAKRGSIVTHDVSNDASYKTHRLQTTRKGLNARLRVERWEKAGIATPSYDRVAPQATSREKFTEQLISGMLRLGRNRWFRYPIIKFLTSGAAIPLIHARLYVKKRKYRNRS